MKVCPYCAEELADDVVVCTHCGKDTTERPNPTASPSQPSPPSAEEIVRASSDPGSFREQGTGPARPEVNRMAIASFAVVMVVGLLGSATEIPPGAAVAADLVALGLGVAAITSSRSSRGNGLAAAAIILATLGLFGYGRLLI